MSPSPNTLILESLRLEPSLSATCTFVDLDAVDCEVAMVDAQLLTLLVRAEGVEAPSANILMRACVSIVETQDIDVVRTLLSIPVIALPEEQSRWPGVVRKALMQADVWHLRHAAVLFVRLPRAPIDEAWKRRLLEHAEAYMGKRFDALTRKPSLIKSSDPVKKLEPASKIPSSFDAAQSMRDRLLKNERWLTSTQVAAMARDGMLLNSNPHQHASRLRRERRMLGVRVGGQFRHPLFQFVPATGELHPKMAELLALLSNEGHGWTAVLWCFAPTHKLGGLRPADVFQADPHAVIDAARRHFKAGDADW